MRFKTAAAALVVLLALDHASGQQQHVGLLRRGEAQNTHPSSGLATLVMEDRAYWKRVLEDGSLGSMDTASPTAAPTSGSPTAAPTSGTPTAAPTSGTPTAAPTSGTCKTLLWSDEFDSSSETASSPDDSIWSFDLGNGEGGWGNLELQNYTNDLSNVRVQDGKLIITALAAETEDETSGQRSRAFTSGRIRTEDKVEILYGNIEAKIKIPDLANGMWPAFWSLGGNCGEVGWPFCGEVDIMEMGSADAIRDGVINRRVISAAHWEDSGSRADFSESFDNPTDLNDGEFHRLRLEWTPSRFATFVDENAIWEMDISPEKCTDCTEFHQPHFLILNMAVGGLFTGLLSEENITAPFPAEMVVDYVRVCDNGDTVLSGSVIEEPVDFGFDCGAPESCTKAALNNYAGEFTCGSRIRFLIESEGLSEEEACRQIAGKEFPSQCGQCISQVLDCDLPETCTDAVLDTDAEGFSCRERISFLVAIQGLSDVDACNLVAGVEFSSQCGPCNPIDCNLPDTCTDAVLDMDTEGPTCRDRITFLIQSSGFSETEACSQVAGVEFPAQCGPCNPPIDCNQPQVCTNAVLDADADGFSCRDRITFLIQSSGLSEIEACNEVAGKEFPSQCGPCNPIDCNQPDLCTNAVLDADADGFSCRDRITFLIQSSGFSETEACNQVAGVEFPSQCGPCNPIDCNLPETCTDAVLDMDTEGPTCRDRITFLIQSSGFSETEACNQVAGVEFPAQCSPCNPIDCNQPQVCTNAVLDADADGFSCRDRITFLIQSSGLSEIEACNEVAGKEFPSQCGPCNPIDCNQPDLCTNAVLDSDADGFSCRDRITFLIQSSGLSETEACNQIAGMEFPPQCGPCKPIDCGQPDTCTDDVLNADTEGPTCRDRIVFLIQFSGSTETEACRQVAGMEFPTECGGCNPPNDA